MSYDPYAPREAEEPSGYSPIKRPVTLRDIGRKLWAPFAAVGVLFWKLKFLFVAIFKFKLFTVAGSMLISIGAYALFWGWQFAIGFVAAPARARAGSRPRGEAAGAAGLRADVHPLPRRADHAEAAARQRLERGEGRDRGTDPRRPRCCGDLGARRVLRLRAARRARLHGLLPQPLQPGADLAPRRRPDRRGDPPCALGRRAPRAWSA